MAGRVVALGDDGVHPGLELAPRLAGLADEPHTLAAALVGRVEQEGRAAEPRGDDRHALLEQHLELGAAERLVESAPLVEIDGSFGMARRTSS